MTEETVKTKRKTSRKTSRRTPKSVLEKVFPNADKSVIDYILRELDVTTLKAMGEITRQQGNPVIFQAFRDWAGRLAYVDLSTLDPEFVERIREVAEQENLDFHSLFGRKGLYGLADVLHRIAGYHDYRGVLEELEN